MKCEIEESCVSSSLSNSSLSTRSSDWKHVYQEIRKEVELAKHDHEAMELARREAAAGPSIIHSKQISTLWMKVQSTKYLSLVKGNVVVYNNHSWLLLFDLSTGTRSVFSPQNVEKNNGVGYHIGHATLDVLAVAEVSRKPHIFLVQYPSMETIAVVSDNTPGSYDTLAFSGERMLLTLKSGLKLNISIWDWKSKARYFNIQRESYSPSISLRGSGEGCLFSLLCQGKPSKLYLWEMSIFTDIVSLFSKHCSEDKDIDLRDQCLLASNLYAVDAVGDIYKAHKESSDHLKFIRIVEAGGGGVETKTSTGLLDKGPFIVGLPPLGLAVYGPTQTIKFYKKMQSGWVCERTLALENPIHHLISTPQDKLIAWDIKKGLIQIGQEVKSLEDRRIMTDPIDSIVIIHPDDVVLATLLIKRKVHFWTIDEGYFISEFVFAEDIMSMLSHPMVPYIAVMARSIGDIYILDVQSTRRPRLHKIVRVSFDPLSSIQFNPKGDYLVAAGSTFESLYLISANPSKSFEITQCVVTRHPFSSFGIMMGESGHEWIVLLLESYRSSNNRYLELLTLPNLTEFIKVDLGESYSQILTCFSKPSTMIALTSDDIVVTRIAIDTRRGKLKEKTVLGNHHVVPPIFLSQDMFHSVSYGKRDGYLILYKPDGQIVLAPHRFSGIRWAAFATHSGSFITFTRDSSLACFKLISSCGHEDESEHVLKYLPYRPLPYSKAKMFRKITKDEIPWDENEDNQKKIVIYKKGVVRTVGKGISSTEFHEILNDSNIENKINTIKAFSGHFDPDILVDYIRKWIFYFRIQAKKFVEYNEFLEAERPAEMIPWDKIKEVEARAYAEYKNSYDQTLAKFMNSVESSIKRWTTAYKRIIETTWQSMQKQPTSIKMIFRDFACQDFGFKKGYENIYKQMEDRISQAYMDFFLHQASENFIWDARFEVFESYWEQYQKYLKEGVESSEDIMTVQKRDSEVLDEEGPEEEEYLVQDLSRYLDEQEPDSSVVFKRRMLVDNVASYSSIHRFGGTMKRALDTTGNLMIRRGDTAAVAESTLDFKTAQEQARESDESLFHDYDEDMLAERPRALKRYRKNKKRVLRRLVNEYPYLDEVGIKLFNDMFKIPIDYPDDCVFLRPGTHLAKATEDEEPEVPTMASMRIGTPFNENTFISNNSEDFDEVVDSKEDVSTKNESETSDLKEEEVDTQAKHIQELESLILQELTGKTVIAKHIVDSDNEAALLAAEQLAKQMKKSKKGKKDVTGTETEVAELVEEEMPEQISKANENRVKRAITKRVEKTTDKLSVITINEEEIKKEAKAPTQALAISDLSKLYLILDVDVLIESNRKRRKRRKSSLDREAMNKLKLREAESKNARMTRLLHMVQDVNTSVLSVKPKAQPELRQHEEGSMDSEASEDVIDMGKARAFLIGAPVEDTKEIRKKVLIVGDIFRFKKRRLILGTVVERSAQEKLIADLVKLGIDGPILPPNYIVVKRQNILNRVNEENLVKDETIQDEEDTILTTTELCWLESALKKFEDSKTKKGGSEHMAAEEEEEGPAPEVEEMAFSLKTKQSVVSLLKGMTEAETSLDKDAAKKEKPRLLATANIETVEEGMAYLMEGTVASNYVELGLFSRRQLNVPTVLNMVTEIAHDCKAIFDVYTYFNNFFNQLRKVKETVMTMIQRHQGNYDFFIKEIQEACKENPVFPEMPPAVWSARENPQMMISVSDEEVPVSRYYSPSELSLKRRLEEEEALKRRQPKPDAFKLEALQIMMDGVVERRWEDELKKDIPYPKCLVGKDPSEFEPEEIAMSLKYEEDVKFHNSERQRYKQILMEKIDKEVEDIRELHLGFDLRVKQMSEKLTEFLQMGKELRMFSFRRFRDKAMQIAFLKAAERARTFTEATKASVDQIESLVKALGKKMRSHRGKMSSIKKKKEQREEKLEDTLKKMTVITSDRSFVIMNYIRPVFVISPKFLESPNLLSYVLDCFDSHNEIGCRSPLLIEFFKDVANSLKRNVPQKLTKPIWEILAQVRRENIRNDIEIAILQLEYNKAEDAAKFFKVYLKQKQSFTEMISKALECSVQRYKTSQFLQEYQIVLPMGMVEIEMGWEQEARMPNSSDIIIMPGEEYEKLLTDRHAAEISLTSQQWKNSVTLENIARLSSRHYELIARNKMLSLNIKHIERYQPSMHSRSLIKEIKESGLRLGGEKVAKRSTQSAIAENESHVKRAMSIEDQIEEDKINDLPTNRHFILADTQNLEEEYPVDAYEKYPEAALETPVTREIVTPTDIDGLENIKDDLLDEKPFEYLFDQNFEFKESSQGDLVHEDSKLTTHSRYSVISTVSKYFAKSKKAESSDVSVFLKPTKSQRTIDKRKQKEMIGDDNLEDEAVSHKKGKLRRVKKVPSQKSIQGLRLSKLREQLVSLHIKRLSDENRAAWQEFMSNIEEMMRVHSWKGPQKTPVLKLDKIGSIELFEEEKSKERSEFQVIKEKYIHEAKKSIQRNNEIWYPKLSARDAELFKKDTGIDFEKYMEVPKDVEEVYDYEGAGPRKPYESFTEAPSQPIEEPKADLEQMKREFAFTGSWPERLVALWKELEGADQASKHLEKLIQKSKKPSLTDYWNYSDFNFKRNMKNNLVSLLKSYKKQVERYWRDSKTMEREMTRYIEMNKKCVLLFFNYELSQTRDREQGAKIQEMTRRAETFSNKRNIKVEKAMKKAELLREMQKNQYEILQLQSELELLQLRTYPILMYKQV